MDARGEVYLVGAGPGDPELLTRRAFQLIQDADAVVYDRLVSAEIMELVPAGTARINVGKQAGAHPVPQEEINALLVGLARQGRRVVRLKGGDPFLFGRGSEEALHLTQQGVSCQVVPGVTSASGCAASAGFPLTHRGMATGVRFVTGHCRDDMELDLDWCGLANGETTLVLYMAAANLQGIADRLIAEGLAPSTPAAAISAGTTPRQRVIRSSLDRISADARQLPTPVLFIVGDVVALASEIGLGEISLEHENMTDEANADHARCVV